MGNSNSSIHDFEHNLKAAEYSAVKRYHDFLLGDFYEMKHDPTGETLLMKVRPLSNIQKYQESIDRTMRRLSLSHKSLIKIKGFAGREPKDSKQSAYKLYIYFEHLPKDLSKFLKSRRNNTIFKEAGSHSQKYLSEAELSKIMTQLIDVLEYLQMNGISHGDVRPEGCFLTELGNVMICDRKLLYEEDLDLNFQKNSEKHFLFSPALLESLAKPGRRLRENKHKGDVFSLGMTLLECATLRRSTNVYEWSGTPSINFGAIMNRLTDVKNRYSPKLCQIIAEMLKFDENVRPDFIKLKKWMNGTELLAYKTKSFSPQKRESVGPSMNRAKIGPKLAVGTPELRARAQKHDKSDEVTMESFSREIRKEAPRNDSPVRKEEDEDEIVEFETEQTPKTTPLMDAQHSYLNIVNNNHKPLVWKASNNKQENLSQLAGKNSESLKFSLPNQNVHEMLLTSPSLDFKTDRESSLGNFKLNEKEDTNTAISNIFTAMNKTISVEDFPQESPSHSKTHQNIFQNKPNNNNVLRLKPTISDPSSQLGNSPYTASTETGSRGPAPLKIRSGSLSPEVESPNSRALKKPPSLDIPAMKNKIEMRLNLKDLSSPQHQGHGGESLLSLTSPRIKPFNPLEYLKDSYGTTTLTEMMTPRDSELKFYNSPRTTLRFESTLYPELAGETEQWRSHVFDSMASLSSPRTHRSNTDLLTQQLQSQSACQSRGISPIYANSSGEVKGFADACNRLGGFHQSKSSIDAQITAGGGGSSCENTPQFKKTGSLTSRVGLSSSQFLPERPGNMKHFDYGIPQIYQISSQLRSSQVQVQSGSKSLKASMNPIQCDPKFFQNEIDQIWQKTTLSKNNSDF